MSEYPNTTGHVAVRLNDYIVRIGGIGPKTKEMSQYEIWTYNLYTAQWRKHHVLNVNSVPSPVFAACAAAIGKDIYMFGGFPYTRPWRPTNELWKLTTTGFFKWSKAEFQNAMKLPSPRWNHSGWEYAECLWVFGGTVPDKLQTEYLCDHGDFIHEVTNQLLCYDPSTKRWTNPQCFGAVPVPQSDHSTATIKDTVWLMIYLSLTCCHLHGLGFKLAR